ncbi:MAG: choice-of-anchor J domain-containing protein [Prevotellaceae bacterium]|jgi:hypothetical protein|nr:choice-of-anchor J domain-containing protein [Prevotellaceae bacterium]
MKKALLIFTALFLTVSLAGQNRQEHEPTSESADRFSIPTRFKSPTDEIADTIIWANMNGNIVVTDIKGNVHDIQAYLDEGKTVIIDYSTVWCGPCWELHHSGQLDELYKRFGPNGTEATDMVLLWVEIDDRSTLNDIRGGDGKNNSQGDWTKASDGSEWPIPIINDVKGSPSLDPLIELYKGVVPTIIMIHPNGAAKDVFKEVCLLSADDVRALVGIHPDENDKPVLYSFGGTEQNYVGQENKFYMSYFGINTDVTWTFPDGTPATTAEKTVNPVWNEAGTYDVKLEVANAGGKVEMNHTIEIVDFPENLDDKIVDFESVMFVESNTFASDLFPYNWIAVNKDNGNVLGTFVPYGVRDRSSFVVVDKRIVEPELVSAIDPYEGNKCIMSIANLNAIKNNDWLISPKIQLRDESSISLYVRSGGPESYGAEEYQISVSTTDEDPAESTFTSTFEVVGEKRTAPFEWTQVEVDLSAYNNQEVYIAINNVGRDHYTFLIDNIEVKTRVANAVDRLLSDRFGIYPNPAKNTVNINCPGLSGIQLFDIQGKEVMSVAANSENETINVSNLPEGHYLVRITTKENKFGTQKITVIKE